jgi:hypothetical protein
LITADKTAMTTQEVATRFNELAQQEKWFEIQDEFFADQVRSIEPPDSPYLKYAEGKTAVRKKGEEFLKKVQEFHGAYTTQPVIGGNHFAVGRGMELTMEGFGRIKIDQIMVYEVKEGQIVSEQFLY